MAQSRLKKAERSARAKELPKKLFFKIGEVCRYTEVEAHVLRYWETEFPQLSPAKDKNGQRLYRQKDIRLVEKIKQLLYVDEYTISGARKRLSGHQSTSTEDDAEQSEGQGASQKEVWQKARNKAIQILATLQKNDRRLKS